MTERSPVEFIDDIDAFAESNEHVRLVDLITEESVREIVTARYGKVGSDSLEAKDKASHMLDDAAYGNWTYYPWRGEAFRLPEAEDFYAVRTARNRHFIKEEEQEVLRSKRVAHIGLSVGSNIALSAAQLGIGSEYLLADHDSISMSNLNRIRAHLGNVGMKKAEWLGQELALIDPYINQVQLDEGYTEDTEVVMDDFKPDVIVEEVDDLRTKALLRQYAKSRCIPLVMVSDIGENSLVDIERHDKEYVKPFNGMVSEKDFDALTSGTLDQKQEEKMKIKIVGLKNISPRLVESAMDPELEGLPQLGTTVAIGAGLGAAAIAGMFLGRNESSGRFKVSQRKVLDLKPQYGMRDSAAVWKNFLARKKA
jgi:molybdopterin/thiamine biosynthesis adenylyltransferase